MLSGLVLMMLCFTQVSLLARGLLSPRHARSYRYFRSTCVSMIDSGGNKDSKKKSYRVVSLSNSGKKPPRNETSSTSEEINEKIPTKNFNKYASKDWNEDDVKRAMMEERVKDANRWESRKLTDEEAMLLNRELGIEKEIQGINMRQNTEAVSSKVRKLRSLSSAEVKSVAHIKGFLEMNPYICPGCGTPFQSKSEKDPGFLPKDKLAVHRNHAELIRNKQEAVRILEMAGIDIDSDAAEEILKEANISPEVIAGVRALGRTQKQRNGVNNIGGSFDDVDEFGDDDEEFIDVEIDVDKMMKEEEAQKGKAISSIKDQLSKVKESESRQNSEVSLINDITMEVISKEQRYGKFNSKDGKKDQVEKNVDTTVSIDDPVCICQRCFRLQQYGKVEESLRPGWSDHELLTPERFQSLLAVIKDSKAVVLCIIDIFDLKGSLLANLKSIAGSNPIVIAANKVDLLPTDASIGRLTNWIHAEVKDYCGLLSPRDSHENSKSREKVIDEAGILRRSNVHLVSCQSGYGIESLMRSITGMAADHGSIIYVMGAANVGKSSFINRLLDTTYNSGGQKGKKPKRSNVPQATVSNLPGTTLDFLKIRLPNGLTMIDTPGLINKGQLTAKLTTDELKQVIPRKPIDTVTLRVSQGKCILMGGLARIELLEGLPFFFTFFVSNEIKLHPTASDKVDEFLTKHVGSLVFPPISNERLQQLGTLSRSLTFTCLLTYLLAKGPFQSHVIDVKGEGWRKSSIDIVIAGLGWVSITGSGECRVKVTVPSGTSVSTREALLPYEVAGSTASFTGGRIDKKAKKSSSGGGRRV